MNKKGFVLIETIVVSCVVVISLLALYTTFNLLTKKQEQEKYYDNINDLYITYFLRENINTIEDLVYIDNLTCQNYMAPDCANLLDELNIKTIIITNNVKGLLNDRTHQYKNTLKNYIRNTSFEENDKKILVEFNKFNKYYYTSINYYIQEGANE